MNIEEDFKEFFGYAIEELRKTYPVNVNIEKLHQNLFKDIDPKTKDQAISLYTNNEFNFAEKISQLPSDIFKQWYNEIFNSTQYSDILMRGAPEKFFGGRKDVKILDYGCGMCKIGLALWEAGYRDITVADVPSKWFEFLKFICKKHGKGIKFIDIIAEKELKEKYEYIVCCEVLEHVWEPLDTLRYLYEHLVENGYMYLSTFFNDMDGHEPYHLIRNNCYQYNNYWYRLVEAMGLIRWTEANIGCWKVFKKVEPVLRKLDWQPYNVNWIRTMFNSDQFLKMMQHLKWLREHGENTDRFVMALIDVYFKDGDKELENDVFKTSESYKQKEK